MNLLLTRDFPSLVIVRWVHTSACGAGHGSDAAVRQGACPNAPQLTSRPAMCAAPAAHGCGYGLIIFQRAQ